VYATFQSINPTNGLPWPGEVWLGGVSYTSATFLGQCGQTYGFASTVRDRVGNTEALPSSPDASIVVTTNCVAEFRLGIARSLLPGGQGELIQLIYPGCRATITSLSIGTISGLQANGQNCPAPRTAAAA
jgi:hypothetical protein